MGRAAALWPPRAPLDGGAPPSREGGRRRRRSGRPAGMSRKQGARARPAAGARKVRRPRQPPAGPAAGPGSGGGGLAGQLRALGLKLREVPGDG